MCWDYWGVSITAAVVMGKSIVIIGGGAFGISTAWHLSQSLGEGRKYSSICVLDRFPPPSQAAAASDINKMIRTQYSDPVYVDLAMSAMKAWTDPTSIFNKHFHQSGWLLCASGSSVPFIEESAHNALRKGVRDVRFIKTAEVRSIWPVFTGSMKDWKILSDPAAGWAASNNILLEMAEESAARGVSFISGNAGHVQSLLLNESCTGVRTVDGTIYHADHVVLAAGANTASLIDMEGQHCALGHTVCFIKLRPEEVERYQQMTLIANIEEVPGVSLPRYREDNPRDDVPDEIQRRLRGWVREVMPELAERPWSETRICWDTETANEDFVICRHPRQKGLIITTGGSGHAFKFLPTLGTFVSQVLEGTLPRVLEEKWQWGSSTSVTNKHKAKPMFAAPIQELSDLPGWQSCSAKL
ncbi:sarcosine oxidase [Exophiala viscosa]|uniref:Sarcosine oxidase n=1 Tax=Exophiala viscosa TaxID=2486360 RepID=A0AAN6DQG6_9EURO|nr:sarcosine oxidase [Exophiala viscosa]